MRRSLPGSLLVRTGLRLLRGYTGPAARGFATAADDPAAAQRRVLAGLIQGAAGTGYGRHHAVHPDDDYAAFRDKLPVVGWQDLQPWLTMERESPGALAPAAVQAWVRSGGKTGPAKRVPYTAALKRSFERMFYVWAHDLLSARLRLSKGYCYLNIVPPESVADGRGDIEDESEYLSGSLGLLARRFIVGDPRLRRLRDPDGFRAVLAAALLSAADLEVVSIWDPQELLDIVDRVLADQDELVAILDEGRLSREGVVFRFAGLARERRAALIAGDLLRVWPALRLISCWTTAGSAAGAAELARRFPGVLIQGKGIVAVEAPVTVPIEAGGYVPLVDELFIELEEPGGGIRRLHEAEPDGEYQLIISQRSGLLRYRLGDRVKVTGHWRGTPCLEYLGRAPHPDPPPASRGEGAPKPART